MLNVHGRRIHDHHEDEEESLVPSAVLLFSCFSKRRVRSHLISCSKDFTRSVNCSDFSVISSTVFCMACSRIFFFARKRALAAVFRRRLSCSLSRSSAECLRSLLLLVLLGVVVIVEGDIGDMANGSGILGSSFGSIGLTEDCRSCCFCCSVVDSTGAMDSKLVHSSFVICSSCSDSLGLSRKAEPGIASNVKRALLLRKHKF